MQREDKQGNPRKIKVRSGFLNQVFIESISRKAIGAKIKTGIHAQSSGTIMPKTSSVASILQTKLMMSEAAVMAKLIAMADFIDLGSRQTRTGRQTRSITRFIMGSVILKCFWL